MKQIVQPGLLSGTIQIPASKSDSQRAILCAALSDGVSVLTGVGKSDDEQAMLRAVAEMGAKINVLSDSKVEISGISHFPENVELSAAESGLGLRLLTCVAASFNQKVILTGRGSLLKRPMNFLDAVLPQFGCAVASNHGFLPLEVQGPLVGTTITVDGSLSSQFISGLLMALPRSRQSSVLTVLDMKSGPYIQMTIRTLKQFGIKIEQAGSQFEILGNQLYQSTDYSIEADWSSASYWLVAAAVGHSITVSGLKMNSLQADKVLLDALISAGCKISFEAQTIRIDGSELHSFMFDATDCPDLFPALVVLAAKCNGISTFKGVDRLIHKESNRGVVLQSEFGKMGLKIELKGNFMTVFGTGLLNGAAVDSHHDHRIAMCMAIAGTLAIGETNITNAEAVSKSYPDFWNHLSGLTNHFAV
ncbi:3-phosphoshikimate 1-carboxyvinyltransferase [Fluviicola taffensis]|uniref:3-phosphoshikimate 1-carboxyvinyltransferase n=1 Tax=Fluviicola taffensis (strain DSM 16823 / NCIMB 13979 / RW262) TaxID=755732 RepID=F2IC72_FLUTR|nr:3-phosphoshikimate 1-carboxyvinyltransferase [Fluviicola taffensis]AEA44318.1 3-phosphoshikimate 1-carboxyvinyltransferase [Fluviicola taffensis DSM 16823]